MRSKSSKGPGKRDWNSIWHAYVYRAKKRGFSWHLTHEEFDELIRMACYYCGGEPELVKGNTVTVKGVRQHYSGVDRRNNEPYYSKENAVPCCATCNMLKGSLNEEEFIQQIVRIHAHKFRVW